MKLFLCKNNPDSLKVILALKLGKKPVDIAYLEQDGSTNLTPKQAPVLITENGDKIFSGNAACAVLFKQDSSLINRWLDIEASILQPTVVHLTSKIDEGQVELLNKVLADINLELGCKLFLIGKEISLADVSVWSTLYPILSDNKLQKQFIRDNVNILKWHEMMLRQQEVGEAVKLTQFSGSSVSCLTSLLSTRWFPPSHSIKQKPENIPIQDKPEQSDNTDSPTKEFVVTEEELQTAKKLWLGGALMKKINCNTVPVLPVANERNILITSALPYVNNVPHLGNIIGCVLSGDVFARYCRMRGYNTLYVCGTDEYGTATETKALEEGLTPQQICDKYFQVHDSVYKWFNICFDIFGRTTTQEQTEICQDMFTKIHNNGYIIKDSVEQLLCQKCDRYLADRFVEGVCPTCKYEDARGDQCDGCGHLINATELIKPRCKVCQEAPVIRLSTQFFLDLPKIEPKLKEWLDVVSLNWSNNARVIAKSWIRDGLKPRCITRDLKWGIPVPLEGYSDKVFYVWFDAPIGYISITARYTDQWKQWWLPKQDTEVQLFQFIGKDNVPFHSVMFPATLLSSQQPYTTVHCIYATEYLNYEDGKFSKSRGVGVFGTDAQETGIPADVWRFYLLYVRPESQDSNFSWIDLVTKNNSELLNNLGNFVNRALVFAEKNFGCKIPVMDLQTVDYQLVASINREISQYISSLEKGKLREGIRYILSISRLGNQYMQSSQPWVLLKGSDDDKIRASTIIALSCNISCLLCSLLYPYMPETAEVLKKQLNAPDQVLVIDDKFTLLLKSGHKLGKPSPLFNKIEVSQIDQLKAKYSGRQRSKTPERQEGEKTQTQAATMSVEELEAAIQKQGDLVRQMKGSGKEKGEWQPQVTKLLDLKKQLTLAQANVKEAQKPDKQQDAAKKEKTTNKEAVSGNSQAGNSTPNPKANPPKQGGSDGKRKKK